MTTRAQAGFSVAELMAAVAIGGMILVVTIPAFSNFIEDSRLNGAVREIVSDVREIRGRAVSTGWQYRIVGYGTSSVNSMRGQYRILGRRSTATAWPAETAASFENATQLAQPWVDLEGLYPGVTIDATASDERYELTFDRRGSATGSTFDGLQMIKNTKSRTINVSTSGGIQIQ